MARSILKESHYESIAMPASVTSPASTELPQHSLAEPGPKKGRMGKRQVTKRPQPNLTDGLTGTRLNTGKSRQWQIKPVTAPAGLSLTDQSNLTTLSHMEPVQICQGVLNIETLNELHALTKLLQCTCHKNNSEIQQIISYKATELMT